MAGPAASMLAAPGCRCQRLAPTETKRRLLTPGLGPLASVETRFAAAFDLWIAVARGADPRAFGAAADVTLGLGSGRSEDEAKARATGEVLERYGAAIVPDKAPDRVSLATADGAPAGWADSARVWLPFQRRGRPCLPASSAGLAFHFNRPACLRAARSEWIERQALDRLYRDAPRFVQSLPLPHLSIPGGRAFVVSDWQPVVLVLLPGDDGASAPAIAAGAASAATLDAALAAATREATVSWLLATGAVLPGSGLTGTDLLGPLATLPLKEWHKAAPGSLNAERVRFEPAFADITPSDLRAGGGWLFRALQPEGG